MGFFSGLGAALSVVNPVAAIGTALGGAADFWSSEQARNDARHENADNRHMAQAMADAQMGLANRNIELQKEFAQNGISWRIADAAKSGISPLAALGASTPGYSPVSAVMSGSSSVLVPEGGIGAMGRMGQNLSRSLLATKTPDERLSLALDNIFKDKQNNLLDVQIKQAEFNLAKSMSPGIPLAYQPIRNRDGSMSYVPSEESARSSHGSFMGPIRWSLDNQLIPTVGELEGGSGAMGAPFMLNWRK